jgi:hypothetical protein
MTPGTTTQERFSGVFTANMSDDLTFTQEIVVGIWRGEELLAIERKNGRRFMVKPADWGDVA